MPCAARRCFKKAHAQPCLRAPAVRGRHLAGAAGCRRPAGAAGSCHAARPASPPAKGRRPPKGGARFKARQGHNEVPLRDAPGHGRATAILQLHLRDHHMRLNLKAHKDNAATACHGTSPLPSTQRMRWARDLQACDAGGGGACEGPGLHARLAAGSSPRGGAEGPHGYKRRRGAANELAARRDVHAMRLPAPTVTGHHPKGSIRVRGRADATMSVLRLREEIERPRPMACARTSRPTRPSR